MAAGYSRLKHGCQIPLVGPGQVWYLINYSIRGVLSCVHTAGGFANGGYMYEVINV